MTLVGVRVHVRPVKGDIASASETEPVNPFRAETVMVEFPLAPARDVTELGLADKEKSWSVNVTVVGTLLGPFDPVTVTV